MALLCCLILVGTISFYALSSPDTAPDIHKFRIPAAENYEMLSACEKQEILWNNVMGSVYKDLPDYQKLGLGQLMRMAKQELEIKGSRHLDFAPAGWIKYLHRRGVLAKVKIVPTNTKYSGVFQGADCALLRLSLTYKTAGSKPVAPGMALKILRDKTYSANISALVSLDGQKKDFNFFQNPMSHIVPLGKNMGQKLVHGVFDNISAYPEELLIDDLASIDSAGRTIKNVVSPRQIFFVPNKGLGFSSEEHDVRNDFLSIPQGTVVYQIYALAEKPKDFDYSEYSDENAKDFLAKSEHIADIVTTSEFLASEFSDDGIFFRHQLRYK